MAINSGPSRFQSSLQLWTGRLLSGVEGVGSPVTDLCSRIHATVDTWQAETRGPNQAQLREELFQLRTALEQNGGVAPETKQAFEKLRNLAFHDCVRAALAGYPGGSYAIQGDSPDPTVIPNFQRVNNTFLRGGQAMQEGLDWLAAGQARTEVDLRDQNDLSNQWAPPSRFPLKRYSLSIPDYGTPEFATVERYLQIVDDPGNQPTFTHCKAGIGRTGVMTACWRIAHGMSADEALALENINSAFGHLKQEKFVRDFETYWLNKQLNL